MELIRCKNGHRYDPSLSAECPECAALAGASKTVPLGGGNKTVPLGGAGFGPGGDSYSPTVPLRADTVPVNPAPSHWADVKKYDDPVNPGAAYNPTMPFGYDTASGTGTLPVTGWLVCIDGPSKGKDYRLHAEYNYIGRSADMDVVLADDPTVSREKHAVIAYDTQDRMFFFAPASGANIVRHNGRAVLNNVELKHGDRIQVGKGTFLFVPLCGENFQWD